jgi:glycosyltransferase involved in cell wall biosynthesis
LPVPSSALSDPLASRSGGASKPLLLMPIYAHADYFPPTINAACILSTDFVVQVVCRNTDAPAARWHPGVEMERVGALRSRSAQEKAAMASKLLEFGRYVRALSRSGAKFIYAYDPIAFAAAMLARRRGVPIIFHCHDVPTAADLPARSLQSWLIHYALKRTREAAFVVFPERNRAAHWLSAASDDREPLIVPNGAPRNFYSPPCNWPELFSKRFENGRILYMSSMGPENGHLEAVSAAAEAGFSLDLCGPGSPAFVGSLEQLIMQKNAADRIRVRGWLKEPERKPLIDNAAVGLVLYKPATFNWEFSASAVNKLFEYGAAGLPVVVPDRGSYREFLGSEKWIAFADVNSPHSIASAIVDILADRNRYVAMSHAAREAHEKRLNYELLFAPVAERFRAMAGIGDRIAAA